MLRVCGRLTDPSVVDQSVKSSEFLLDVFHGGVNRRLIGHIKLNVRHGAFDTVGRLELRNGLSPIFCISTADEDVIVCRSGRDDFGGGIANTRVGAWRSISRLESLIMVG